MTHDTSDIKNGHKAFSGRQQGKSAQRKFVVQVCFIAVLVALLFIVPNTASPVLAGEETVHVVKPGESLSLIAGRYGVNVYALARYNGIANINIVRVGQAIRIPGESVAPATPLPATPLPATPLPATPLPIVPMVSVLLATPTVTKAKAGDRSRTNGINTPTPVVFDDPTPTLTPVVATPIPQVSKIRVHVVLANQNLTSIGNLYGVTPSAIKRRNGLIDDTIYRGQRLIIP